MPARVGRLVNCLTILAACAVLWPAPGGAVVAISQAPDRGEAAPAAPATGVAPAMQPAMAASQPVDIASAPTGDIAPAPTGDAAPAQPVDLATYPATRWIVQLADPPLAAYTGGIDGLAPTAIEITGARRLDLANPDVRAYRQHLTANQRSFRQTLAKVALGHRVDRIYTITVNGLAVKMTAAQAAAVRALPGVRAVTPDIPMQLQMFSTPAQIGAPAVWAKLGGKDKAGSGVKVGIIDGGIYMFYDEAGNYAGNACFRDEGYTMPPGYPKGDERFTNKKVIVARAYFRPDDPPQPGSETPLPGLNRGDTAHGTHVAGTVACEPDTPATYQGVDVTLDGVAPKAYLMNYKVFYGSQTGDGFQRGNAFVAELVKSIEDAIEDGADVISNSWGSSYQNTLAWPDPMVQAAELAMKSGVVAVFANGNSGGPSGHGHLAGRRAVGHLGRRRHQGCRGEHGRPGRHGSSTSAGGPGPHGRGRRGFRAAGLAELGGHGRGGGGHGDLQHPAHGLPAARRRQSLPGRRPGRQGGPHRLRRLPVQRQGLFRPGSRGHGGPGLQRRRRDPDPHDGHQPRRGGHHSQRLPAPVRRPGVEGLRRRERRRGRRPTPTAPITRPCQATSWPAPAAAGPARTNSSSPTWPRRA